MLRIACFVVICVLPFSSFCGAEPTGQSGSDGRSEGGVNTLPEDAFPVHFDSEWIRLSVLGDTLEVSGIYRFRCRYRSGARMPMVYPFPKDSLLGGARMVSLRGGLDGGDLRPLPWDRSGEVGIRFQCPRCDGDTITIEAVYRQALTTSYGRYIVTTTREWHRPLRHARFDLRLPPGAVPTEFSFPFTAREDANGPLYTFEADSFYPERDIVFRWRSARPE